MSVVCAIYMLKIWNNILKKIWWKSKNTELHVKSLGFHIKRVNNENLPDGNFFFWKKGSQNRDIEFHFFGCGFCLMNLVLVLVETFFRWLQQSHLKVKGKKTQVSFPRQFDSHRWNVRVENGSTTTLVSVLRLLHLHSLLGWTF